MCCLVFNVFQFGDAKAMKQELLRCCDEEFNHTALNVAERLSEEL